MKPINPNTKTAIANREMAERVRIKKEERKVNYDKAVELHNQWLNLTSIANSLWLGLNTVRNLLINIRKPVEHNKRKRWETASFYSTKLETESQNLLSRRNEKFNWMKINTSLKHVDKPSEKEHKVAKDNALSENQKIDLKSRLVKTRLSYYVKIADRPLHIKEEKPISTTKDKELRNKQIVYKEEWTRIGNWI